VDNGCSVRLYSERPVSVYLDLYNVYRYSVFDYSQTESAVFLSMVYSAVILCLEGCIVRGCDPFVLRYLISLLFGRSQRETVMLF